MDGIVKKSLRGPLNRIAHEIIMNYDTTVTTQLAYRTEFFTIIVALQTCDNQISELFFPANYSVEKSVF